ncbi:hypothetical protein ACFY0F_38185 [Streptomyces sp. NPDC001544]|uniref:hypothetical protein n=1 Tax=Streptomyces sp. NPDC001544 TaxID=3364584 RepID=UPI003675A832
MTGRTRTLRFTAVLAFLALSLTGFSTGRHHSRHGSGGGGGGCSSDRQDHDTSSSTSGGGSYDDSDDGSDDDSVPAVVPGGGTGGSSYKPHPTHRATSTSGSSGGSGKPLENAETKLISCATVKRPYATVEVKNPNGRKATFSVDVSFRDDADAETDFGSEYVTVPAKGTAQVRVKFSEGDGTGIDHCRVNPEARPE